jgi:hypothetical protein
VTQRAHRDCVSKAHSTLPEILSYDRRAVRQRFEERFTATRMAKDYVSVYHRLLKTHTARAKLHQAGLNGGNGSTLMSIEESLPSQFEASANPDVT